MTRSFRFSLSSFNVCRNRRWTGRLKPLFVKYGNKSTIRLNQPIRADCGCRDVRTCTFIATRHVLTLNSWALVRPWKGLFMYILGKLNCLYSLKVRFITLAEVIVLVIVLCVLSVNCSWYIMGISLPTSFTLNEEGLYFILD